MREKLSLVNDKTNKYDKKSWRLNTQNYMQEVYCVWHIMWIDVQFRFIAHLTSHVLNRNSFRDSNLTPFLLLQIVLKVQVEFPILSRLKYFLNVWINMYRCSNEHKTKWRKITRRNIVDKVCHVVIVPNVYDFSIWWRSTLRLVKIKLLKPTALEIWNGTKRRKTGPQ